MRQKFAASESLVLTVQVGENYRHIAAEFPNDLPAGAARRCQVLCVRHYYDAGKMLVPVGNRFPNGHALGTDGQSVAGRFHIAARIYLTAVGHHGGTDLE